MDHAHFPVTNADNGANAHSPTTDDPETPVDTAAAPDVKIDMDYQEQESDVRHEPLPIKDIDHINKQHIDDASTVPQVTTPCDPNSIPIHPPHGTPPPPPGELLEDVKMAEQPIMNGHANGHGYDIDMREASHTPAATPGISQDFSMASIDGSGSNTRSYPNDDEDEEPPAKRMRTNFDSATPHSATPPPASAMSYAPSSAVLPPASAAPPPNTASSNGHAESRLTLQQLRFLASTVRTLKKLKDAMPFLLPVDPIALNIPHYPSIVKHPMDFSTIERKLNSSNPTKPDPNLSNPRYYNAEELIADVRLMVSNAVTFNGPDHVVAQMGKRMEETFDKQLKHLPPAVVEVCLSFLLLFHNLILLLETEGAGCEEAR
jgi:bromodomain-containing factor 1